MPINQELGRSVQRISSTLRQDLLCLGMGWFPDQPGGLNRYVYELMQELTKQDQSIAFCSIDLPLESGNDRLQLRNLGTADQNLVKRLWAVHQNFQLNVASLPAAINLHFALYSLPVLAKIPAQTPITFTFHGPWAGESAEEGASRLNIAFKKWVEQRVYDRCDRFITLSQAFADILHQDYKIPYAKIHTIPGGINTTAFQITHSRQQARIQMGFPLDRPILFTPRRLVQRMGIDKLLEAIVIVKQQVPHIWLAIAGKGAQRQALEAKANILGLSQHVQFLGYVPDAHLPICYQAADLTVVPSQSLEGFGLVLLESLACGTPVLSTPIGGMPEVLRPFDPNLVTDDASAEALADRLLQFFAASMELPNRQACRNYAVQNYDWRIIAPQVSAVLTMPQD
jgi:glycosyltransferase involved in cell wall biosynthesis